MKEETVGLTYNLENQSFIELMYKGWVLIFSIAVLVPLRWLPTVMPKGSSAVFPVLPIALALVTCGELVLNNPTITPAGPYCKGDVVTVSFTGTNLPEGENIQVFIDDVSTYNPFSGGGTPIGTALIDYNCSTCPSILAIMADPCSGGTAEEDNEFIAFSSGCGFNVSDLLMNYDPGNNSGGSANSDICSSCGCTFVDPSASLIAQLRASSNCSNLINPANGSSTIPGGAVVIIFTNSGTPSVPYNIDDLCAKGVEIYILQSSCDRTLGAFTNNPPSGTRTYAITTGSCTDQVTYGFDASYPSISITTESIYRTDAGAWVYMSGCSNIPWTSIDLPNIPIQTASLNYTIPADICGSNNGSTNFYLSGIIDILHPCADILMTPPSALSMSVMCAPVITPSTAGPFCENDPAIQLTATPAGGTWSGSTGVNSSTGVFTPDNVTVYGVQTVIYTILSCAEKDTILITVYDAPTISINGFDISAVTCEGENSGSISFNPITGLSGGTGPFDYDWDDTSLPGNQAYDTDHGFGAPGVDSLFPGFYELIVTDANGCTATFTVEVEDAIPFDISTQITNVTCNGGTNGGLQITNPTMGPPNGPPGVYVYNWDWIENPGDEDYGPGETDWGFPPEEDDPQDILTGLEAGSYLLTITVYDDPLFISFICIWDTILVITEPAPVVATINPNPLVILCFGGSGSATVSGSGGTPYSPLLAPYSTSYMFNWSHIGGTNNPPTVTGLTAGTYIVTVTDVNGCSDVETLTVTQPASALTATAVGETLACNDGTGNIDLTPSGGTSPYTYIWSNSQTTQDLANLLAGTYTVTITDANGCTTTASASIIVTPPTFVMPSNGGSIVPCISNAQVVPTPPVVLNSCGTPLNITGPTVTADPVCSGTKVYTFTYTDPVTGNSALWTYTYTISPPTFTVPANGTSTVACISNAQVAPTPPVVMNSCGATITPTGPVVGADPVCSGTKVYTWTYTDCTGTALQWTHTYTISPPTFTMPGGGSSTVACIVNAQVVPTPPVVLNSCGVALVRTGPVVSGDPVCSGTKTYTWTYTDCTGNSAPWVYTYTVSPPTVTMPAGGASTVACIINAQTVPTPPVVNNSCGAALSMTGPVVSADPVCSGTKTYTWTYTDCTGTTYPWVFTYTVSPPTMTLPANGALTVACIINAQTVPTPPAVTNSCGTTITPTGPVVGADPVCSGTKTYTWTYTNCTGSSSQWVFTYTVSPPTFSLPANGSSTVACIVNAQTVPTPPAVMNSCGATITPTGPVVGPDPVCSGTKTYTWTYTDCTGTALQWVYTYTVSPPTFTVPAGGSSTVPCIVNAQVVPTPPTVMNSCGATITPTGPVVSADPVCSGTKTYTWTYTDCTGSSLPWVYTYTIQPATFTLPANGSATVACIINAQTVPTPPTVTNTCGQTVTPTGPVVGANPVCSGTKTYTWTYTDCSGNAFPWVFTYTVSPPTFSLPAGGGSTVACISNAQTVPTPPVVNNSCGAPLTISGPAVGADPVCSGTKTYTFTYTDCTGTSAPWVYTYTISPPTVTAPAPGNATVACIIDAQVVPVPPVVNNSCGAPLTRTGPVVSADPVCSGTKTYTWTYTDCTGSTVQYVFTYTVSPPTSSLPAGGSSTVACISNAQIVPSPPAVDDSCGDPLSVTGPVVSADPVCSGTKTYTWTYTNCTGASAPWVYTYTISPPTFSLPANGSSTVACIVNAQTVPTAPTVMNSCGATITPTGPVVGPNPVCSGTKTYTWTYTDCTGSSLQWVFTYTVSPPTFTVPAGGSSTVPCLVNAQVVPTPPAVTNSCGATITPTGPVVSADPVCGGSKTYTWTYTDCTGSSLPWVYTYTILPSTFTLPANGSSTVACISNAQTVPTAPTVTNTCGEVVVPTGPVVGADPVCSGTKTYTWTYTDCTGNALPWVYTYTVSPPTFSMPAGGGSTVPCISNAQTVPTPPVVNNSCGAPLTISGPVVSADPVCSGTKTYTFTYTDCTGNSAPWVYTYTISPPTVTPPAPGNATVACVSDAQVVPVPPVVNNSCGAPLTRTGPVVSADPVCSGTKTYTWTYTDCTGGTVQYVFTYTINPPTSSLPAGGSSTVACISNAQTVPSPPAVDDSCGDPLSITGPVVGADPVCSGTKTYTWTYTSCTGSTAQWVYTYTISPPTFSLPANGSSTVACIINAQTTPTAPVVTNSCGATITPTGPVVSPDPVCSGTKTYTWTYTDCTGTALQWVYTYTVSPPTFTVPAGGSSTVPCIVDAQVVPAPPAVTNSCGATITPTGPVVSADPVCGGPKTYTWTYTDCTGSSLPWVYTYTIQPSTFSLPANGSATVACIINAQTVPTPPTVTNTCGEVVVPTGPVVGADPVCSGTKTYTWTYTDCTGNALPWVFTYTVSPPTFSLPAGGGSTVPCIINAQTVPTPPVVNNSCGAPLTISGPVVSADPVCSGTKTYTFTYTDCTGNSAPWVYTYTITPPTVTPPAPGNATVACVSDAQVVPVPPVVNNSCGAPLTRTGPVVSADPVCSGTKTYTWTYTDCTGGTVQYVFTYTVNPPTSSLPAGGSSTVACISDAQTVPSPPAVDDSCGDPLSVTGPVVSADPVCSGTKTYTWTYTNCTGSNSPWVYTYTISPPTFSLPANGSSTVACIINAQTVPAPPSVTNSCGATITPTGPVVSADPVCSGTKTYTWTYTDCTGSSLQWVYTYTVSPPTFSLPADGSSTVSCIIDAQVPPAPPTVNNSCGSPINPTGPVVSPDPVCSGTKTYTWTYTDCTGNSLDWVYTFTITPATFTVPAGGSSTVACISNAQTVPSPPTVTNSCGDPVIPTGPVVGADPVCSGTKTYTWTYTDCSGTNTPWVYTYTISPPTFTLPANGSSTVACISNAQVVPAPPAVNNSCGAPLAITGPVVGADPVCSGTKTFTWTYTDCTGSSAQWVYTYTVSPPTFSLPAGGSSTVACVSDAQVVPTPPVVNNSCGAPLAVTGPVVSADPVCSGTKTYTWTYTDCTGTTGQWVYTYTVTPPTSSLPANGSSTVACISNAQVVPTPPVVNNSCGDPLSVTGPVVGADPVCSGTKTYTWTYTDCTGSSAQWIYTYTVSPPTFTLPANGSSTVACIANAQAVPAPPSVTNSCGATITPTGPVVGADPVCSGTKTYTWTYTDCTGSSLPWVYTYTISPPTFTLPADGGTTVPCIIDAQTPPAPPSVNNSCGDPIVPTGPVASADPVCSGTKTYTWTYTDCTGNSDTWIYTFTINPPTFTVPAPGSSTVACISDAQVVPTPPVVTNSCGDPVTPAGPVVSADPVCSGTKTYTWTYTDCSGTNTPWVYTYTVSPPTFTLPANGSSTVACISNAQVVPAPPAVNNSCGTPLTISGPVVGADPVCSGTKTYTWTYTDCTGSTGQWVYTYTVSPPTFSLPAAGSSTVACVSDAQVVPTPPVVNNSCGAPLAITGPVIGPDPVCSGTKTYTWTYTDCTGTTGQWVYTYTVTPPTSSIPANTGSTVACISDAQVVPVPPVVNNSCGDPLSVTGPVVGADPVCSGTKTYTWTYTDCTGSSGNWVYTYTITPPTFTVPAPGSSTVACIDDAQTVPTPPTVNNSCGDPVTPTGPVIGADPVCSGTKTYTWTYTDCTGSSLPWVYTYTISPPTFTLPANGGSTVPCIIDAQVPPAPPAVNNSCGDPIVPTGPVAGPDPVCSGTKTFTWTYTDCTGSSANWVYTFTIPAPTFTVPADGGSTVACIVDAQTVPSPPTVNNSCGDPVTPTGPVVSADPVCSGTKTYTWTYTDCSGSTDTWIYTYTITPPTFTLPANGSSTVACIINAQTVPLPPVVNNSCGTPLSITGPVVGADPVCSGTKTYTWTYTDCTGTTGQWVYTYTVSPPTFTLPAAGGSTVACISDAQVVPTPPVVNNSCGAPLAITGPVVSADPVCSGTKTYTWTYTDCTGTSGQWVYTYTVSPPTSSVPADGGSIVACISNAQVVPTPPVVNNSCGDPLSVTGPVVGADPVCSGTKTYTWTYTDCTGATDDWVYTYTITPPTFTLPVNGSSTVACISDAQTVPAPPTVINSCGAPIVPSGPVEGADPVCSGTKTYTWTYTDCTGSSQDWVYTYTISPPTFTLPANDGSTVPCVADAQIVPTPPVVSNSCGDPVSASGPVVSPDPACAGTKTYTWTYTDCTGSSLSWVYTYTVMPALFTLPANGTSTVACIIDAQTVPTPPTVTNSCGDPVIPTGPVVGADPVCSGTKVYTWTYTDCNGNSLPWTFTYTITAPTFTLPADGGSTVPCIGDAQTVPVPPVVNNSCGNLLAVSGPVVSADPACSGPKTYTWTYTDCTGNSATWVYTYTITPPSFSLPADDGSTVACIDDAQVVPTPPAADNACGDPLTISGPVVSADPVCSGIKTYTWTYTECTGATGDWVYTYTVSPPTVTMPANGGSTVPCVSDAQVVPTPPVVNNSCGDPLSVTGPVEGADPVCSGTKTYTWTYTDCTGSTVDWVYTYTIPPSNVVLPPDNGSTVACISDAQVLPTPPAVTDACGEPVIPTGPVEGPDPVCSGTKTYVWTYVDCNGNSLAWTYTYTVSPPTFSLPANGGSTVDCIADAQTVPVPPTVVNSCGDPVAVSGPMIGPDPISCSGPKTYTWTYTDCTGNSLDWVYTYTIMPTTFTLPADDGSSVACVLDAQVVPIPPDVTNSCGDPLVATGPVVSADPLCTGTKTYTWTYTDCAGNAADWVYTYTITSDVGPVFDAPPADVTVTCIGDVPVMIDLNYTDDCSPDGSVTGTDSPLSGDCPGTITRTWTFTDECGNTGSVSQTITVDDQIAPTASNPGSLALSGCNVPVPGPDISVVVDAADNCSAPVVAFISDATLLVGCTETTTRTFSVTDACGNSITVTQLITRTVDTTPPVISAPPADITVNCLSEVPSIVDLTFTDNCSAGGTITGVVTGPSGNPVTVVHTWTVTDDCGNSASVSQIITVNESFIPKDVIADFCAGGSVDVYGTTYDFPGTYLDTVLSTSGGCDTLVTILITELPVSNTDLTDDFCQGDSYILPDGSSTTSGGLFGPYTFTGENGCDSIVTLDLTMILPVTNNITDQFCNGDTYILPDGSSTTSGGSYGPYPFVAESGCDSIVNLDLIELQITEVDLTDEFCNGTVYILPDGSTTTTGGSYGPFPFTGSNGCDSLVNLELTGVDPETVDLTDSFCTGDDYVLPDGSTTTVGGSYGPYIFTAISGCDSTVNLDLTGIDPVITDITDEFCSGDIYTLPNGSTTTTGGLFGPFPFTGSNGCDSLVNVDLTLLQPSTGTETYQGCQGDGYTVVVNGTTYSEALPNGVETLPGSNGCDSVVTIDLNFAAPGFGTETYTGCEGDGYSVIVNGTEYNEAMPDGVEDFIGPNGCDTTVTIDLNFTPGLTGTETYSGCEGDGYFVIVNGTTYDEDTPTGTEFFDLPGCDSTVTIDLFFAPVEVVNINDPGTQCTTGDPFTLTATPPGGVWSGDVSSSLFDPSALGVGVHQVIYTVNPGACESADTIDVLIYEITIACLTIKDETMPGDDDGAGQVTISGGNAPYNVTWSGQESGSIIINADGSFTINDLTAGTYTVEVIDATGCTTSCQFVINVGGPCEVIIDSIVIQDATCSGIDDGAISINASGGVIPYEYSIDGLNFQTSNVFTGLAPDTYTIYVKDATGCFVTENVTIGVGPGPELNTVEVVDATCGVLNGSIEVDATGGSTPYTYSINGTTYGASGFFGGLGAGSYIIYLIDAAGCTDTLPVVVAASNAPVITGYDITNSSCGNADGSIEVFASGGVPPLEYSINGVDFQSSPLFTGLPAGPYTITVKDATGCSVTGTATISDIGAPVIDTVNIVEPDCGEVNGTITIIATGTGTLSYSINGTTYVSSNVFGPLAPGPYTVYVRDQNGCITSQPVTINTADGPQIDNIIVVDTECGQENGSITIIASGGTGELEYSIGDGFDDDNEFPDLEEGTYDIIVRDEDGCEATAQVTIEDSDEVDLDVIVEPAHCGMANGCVILDASGGTPPYTYSFNGGSFSPVAEYCNLLSDFYIVIVKDAVGCTTEVEVFVFEQGPPPAPTVETTDPECGLNDGTIEVTNPDDDLQYSISHPNFYQDSPIFYPVAPGTYTVTAKDEWGCTSTAVAVINATPAPVITNVIVVNSTCGASTGSLTVFVTGGTMPYMYSLDGVNFVSSNIFTGLPAGPYTVYVRGANGCLDSEDRVITSVGAQLSSVTEQLCPGDTLIVAGDTFTTTGVHTINLVGGASNGCDSIITLTINPLDLEELTITETICEGEVYTINGVDYSTPGVYLIDTIDGTIGCDTIRTLDLSVDPLETTYIDVTICNQGVYTINGIDYSVAGTYTIDTVNATIGCDSIRILRLEVDDYNERTIVAEICEGDVYTINGVDYTTTDIFLIDTVPGPNGCDTIRSLDLTVNPIPFADAGADQILDCSSPSAVLNGTATNGSPLWTGPGIDAGNETQLNPEVTQPGTYYLTVTSGSNCVDSDSVVVTIDPQTVIAYAGVDDSLSCDIDTVVLQASPIGPNYIYQWTGPGINGTNENLVNPIVTVKGVYTLVVTDTVTGCVSAPDQVIIDDITKEIIAIIQNPNNLDCFSTFVNLNATGSSVGQDIIYIWFNAQGDVIANSPFVDVSSAGTFMFVVKDTLSGCFDEDTVSVEDLSLYPPVDAGDPQQIDCNNNIVTLNEGATNNLENLIFDWEGPIGGILTPDHLLSVDVGTAGFYYLYATDTVSMCTNYDSVLVTSATVPPLADIALLEEFTCLDETAMLDIGLSDTGSDIMYEWNGPQINGVNATMIEPIQPGTFILTVANSTTGCIAFDTVLLELPDLPSDVDLDFEIPLCQGDSSGTLTINSVVGGIPVYTYSLDGDTAQFIPFFEDLAAGNYVLTVVDANGCEYQESFTMPDGVLLTIDIGPNIDIVLGDSIQLNADVSLPWNLIDSIVWASGDHLSCTHCIDPTLYGLLDEVLTATVYAGGCVAEDQLVVRVDVDADVYIPNVFSPNGDDINEWVTVFASDNVRKVVYLEIFDRWGNMVFRNTDFDPNIESLGWDGTFKGKPMNPAVFAFIAKVELINGQHLPFKGDITLLR